MGTYDEGPVARAAKANQEPSPEVIAKLATIPHTGDRTIRFVSAKNPDPRGPAAQH